MQSKDIKKTLQTMIKANAWDMCYGTYGICLTCGRKQMEKGNATINFGYLEDDRYDLEEAYQRFVTSREFKEAMQTIGGTWAREEKKESTWTKVYIRVMFNS